VFLLVLCNDRTVLGPWANGRGTNVFTSIVVGVLITMSVILTVAVLFPDITAHQILLIMLGCAAAGVVAGGCQLVRGRRLGPVDRTGRESWRMPPLAELPRPESGGGRRIGLAALRLYLSVATVLVVVRIVQTVLGH
jgi:hypothetical protein